MSDDKMKDLHEALGKFIAARDTVGSLLQEVGAAREKRLTDASFLDGVKSAKTFVENRLRELETAVRTYGDATTRERTNAIRDELSFVLQGLSGMPLGLSLAMMERSGRGFEAGVGVIVPMPKAGEKGEDGGELQPLGGGSAP